MTFIIIDAQYWCHAAHHVAPNLTRADGHPIGAVHGFTKRLLQFLIRPPVPFDAIAVVFDAPGKNWRHELLPTYKANRTASRASPGGSDLGRQLPLIHAAAEALGVAVLSHPGQEADDIIATLAWGSRHEEDDIVIVSSDKDLLQLVGPGVRVYDTHPARAPAPWQDGNEIHARFGVWPHQIPDYLALVGDAADNIPGATGIGPKSAAKLLAEGGDLENVLSSLTFLSPGDVERLITAKRVATLSRRATFDVSIYGFEWRFDRERALAMCDEHGFRQIRAIIEGEWPASGHTTREGETIVPNPNDAQANADALKEGVPATENKDNEPGPNGEQSPQAGQAETQQPAESA